VLLHSKSIIGKLFRADLIWRQDTKHNVHIATTDITFMLYAINFKCLTLCRYAEYHYVKVHSRADFLCLVTNVRLECKKFPRYKYYSSFSSMTKNEKFYKIDTWSEELGGVSFKVMSPFELEGVPVAVGAPAGSVKTFFFLVDAPKKLACFS